MPKFFLIDQSLDGVGGHHFDFALAVTQASRQAGWETIVAAHRQFRRAGDLGPGLSVRPLFRNSMYGQASLLPGLAQEKAPKSSAEGDRVAIGGPFRFLVRRRLRRREALRRRRICEFAEDCESLFTPDVLEIGDQAFLAGASELEVMGLAAFLSNHPRTNQVRWNVLFHFNVFDGWPSEYDEQRPTADELRACFQAAMARIPFHQVRFFATTDELADQYNRLQFAKVNTLAYPIGNGISRELGVAHQSTRLSRPRQLTLAGGIRREKGQCRIAQEIVDGLWKDQLATGRVQLRIQRPRRAFWRRPKLPIILPAQASRGAQPIQYIDHPLSPMQYAELIRTADIGVLAYDPRPYFARRAGILGEYLAAGRPVAVLGGGWLGEQIQDCQQQHVRHVTARSALAWQLALEKSTSGTPNNKASLDLISFDRLQRPFVADWKLPGYVPMLSVQFECHESMTSGSFVRLDLRQCDAAGSKSPVQTACLGLRENGTPLAALFSIDRRCEQIRLTINNACTDKPLVIRNLTLSGLEPDEGTVPRSAVGAVIPDAEAFPEWLQEMIVHYDHYRSTAQQFGRSYAQRHRAEKTFEQLIQEPDRELQAA